MTSILGEWWWRYRCFFPLLDPNGFIIQSGSSSASSSFCGHAWDFGLGFGCWFPLAMISVSPMIFLLLIQWFNNHIFKSAAHSILWKCAFVWNKLFKVVFLNRLLVLQCQSQSGCRFFWGLIQILGASSGVHQMLLSVSFWSLHVINSSGSYPLRSRGLQGFL